MVRRIPADNFYRIRDPKNFYATMRSDVTLLLKHRAYLSLTTVILCCLDAIAAGSGEASKGKFGTFISRHFPDLIASIEKNCAGKKEIATL